MDDEWTSLSLPSDNPLAQPPSHDCVAIFIRRGWCRTWDGRILAHFRADTDGQLSFCGDKSASVQFFHHCAIGFLLLCDI